MMDQLLSNIGNLNDTSIPPWTLILIEGMKILVTELKVVNELVSKVDDLENYKEDDETLKQDILNEDKRLYERIDELELQIDDNEQRNHNYCLMLHGIEEQDGENTDEIVINTIKNELGFDYFSLIYSTFPSSGTTF